MRRRRKCLETADLSEYDLSEFKPAKFALRFKDQQVNALLPAPEADPRRKQA